MTWRITEHTADLGIEAHGPDRPSTLANAGTALAAVVTGADDPRMFVPDHEVSVVVEAPDEGALVVAWLSELLWLLESEDVLWISGGGTVTHGKDGLRFEAHGNACSYDPSRHGRGTEVKAVTYHGIRFAWEGKEWTLQVLLDI